MSLAALPSSWLFDADRQESVPFTAQLSRFYVPGNIGESAFRSSLGALKLSEHSEHKCRDARRVSSLAT